jgi:hypothetical protein
VGFYALISLLGNRFKQKFDTPLHLDKDQCRH